MPSPPTIHDPTPVRMPNIPKDAVFRRFAWDWVAPNGDRWDHKGNPLPRSFFADYKAGRDK